MNRFVIELSPEDRSRLEALTGAVSLLASVLGSMQPPTLQKEMVEQLAGPAPVIDHPADASTAHFDPPAPVAETPPWEPAPAPAQISLGEFQKALVTRCAESPAVKLKVQALVHQYADSVSAIPEDKRPEVLAALAQI